MCNVEAKTLVLVGPTQFNLLTGSIPEFKALLGGLREIELSQNLLTGTIPLSLTRLTELQRLYLANNRLSGQIPEEFANEFSYISEIHLHGNRLTGTLPSTLSILPQLRILLIDGTWTVIFADSDEF